MGGVSSAEFRSLLSGLEREEFVAFVTDLWAARGIETTVVEDMIVESREDESVRVRTYYQRNVPWGFLPVSRRAPVSSGEFGDVDILVTNADSDRLRTVAETTDVEYVGPARLRRLCLYAIDRDTAEALFRRYFDRPVECESETRAATKWDRVPFVNGAGIDWFGGQFVRETGAAIEGLTVTAVVATLLLATLSAADGPGGVPFHGRSPADLGGDGLDIRRVLASAGSPSGIGRRTLDDATALVSVHEQALDDRTYRLTIRHNGTRGHLVTTDRWRRARQRIHKRSRGRYRFTGDGRCQPRHGPVRPRTARTELYRPNPRTRTGLLGRPV